MTFGAQCNLTQLTRYSYRNLLEGRPAYDSIQVINGATIEPSVGPAPEPQPGEAATDPNARTCGELEPTTTRTIPQVPEGESSPATGPPPTTTTIPGTRATAP
jgi:hypothetical protein